MRGAGAGVIYISHKLEEVRAIADSVAVLRDGSLVAQFARGVSTTDMVSAMVGREFVFEHQEPAPHSKQVNLSVSGLGSKDKFQDITFDTHKGEVFGFAGLVGAGRTEVVRALAGADPHDSGTIILNGKHMNISKPGDSIAAGIVMVPEDRKQLGLLLEQSSSRNLTSPWERELSRYGIVRGRDVSQITEQQRAKYDLRGRTDIPVGRLSGGNQQKVLLAKWLLKQPEVLILDEPTKGVDIGAKDSIYKMIRQLSNEGVTVIVVSSELEEVLGLSHRVAVMAGGRIQGILDRRDADPETVMKLAIAVAERETAESDLHETQGHETESE
jgi:ribose transport system ATP-binding protein